MPVKRQPGLAEGVAVMRDVAAKFIQVRDSQVLSRDDFAWFSGAAASLLATANELSGTEGELEAILSDTAET